MTAGDVTDLYVIRHAQSANNAKPEWERVPDPGLTPLGQDQAQRLAGHLSAVKLDLLITSPFRRTLETTLPLAEATALTPKIWVETHELGGCYAGHTRDTHQGQPGMTRDDIERTFPGFVIPTEIDRQGWWKSQPYESHLQATERARRLLERMRAEWVGVVRRVAVIMHADFKQIFLGLCDVSGWGDPYQQVPYNTSISRVRLSRQAEILVDYNAVTHLPKPLHTW